MTETFERVKGMVVYVRENLSVEEYDMFLDMVAPEAQPEQATKKTTKKRTRKASKSSRAASIAGRIGGTLSNTDKTLCTHVGDSGGSTVLCGEYASNAIHDKTAGYAGYHEFVAGQAKAASGGD